ncbi:FAD-dependent oxidoreductase [bacterium]|nr:FAD-dependent oxidoreductase [bacterium]
MAVDYKELVAKASALLDRNENNQAIEVLRSKESVKDAVACSLLARAYFQRGDSKGDMYSSHFFAARALELGYNRNDVKAIKALSAFRKGQYHEAAETFSEYVTEQSPTATRFIYGMALCNIDKVEDAQKWVKSALKDDPKNTQFATAMDEINNLLSNPEKRRERSIPEKPAALTEQQGLAMKPRDFYWLAKNIPCQDACPAGTDIPEYLRAIYDGDYGRAYRINLRDNVFPGVLGRVCARPCESACRHGWEGLGESVAICFSKRSAADLKTSPPVTLPPYYEPTGKKVAVIGAGVAGLAAARNAALMGHSCTVYEKHVRPGGMMNQGIPVFRLPREIIDREIEQVRMQGVKIVCNTEIGKDITLEHLLKDNDAVIMAAGTLRPNMLDLPGKELSGIRHGLDFLLEVNETGTASIGKNVVVIGGGFTAMDCARTAIRLGAQSVKVCYRRSKNEMLVTPGELEELEVEGIPVEYMITPCGYSGKNGAVETIRFIRTRLGEPDASGRRRPIEIPGSEVDEPAQTVLLATGQFPDTAWIGKQLSGDLVDKDQWLASGSSAGTKIKNLFVAGDFATGAKSLIDAIGHAKETVRIVDTYLMGEQRLMDVAIIEDAAETGRIREMDYVGRQEMPVIGVAGRTLEAEVELGYDQELAIDETQRCYLCHYKFEIDHDRCIYCDWCVKACPTSCIVKAESLKYAEDGSIIGFELAKTSEDTNLIYINQEDCIRCGYCIDVCPVDCITLQKVSRATLPTPQIKETGIGQEAGSCAVSHRDPSKQQTFGCCSTGSGNGRCACKSKK